MVRRLTGVDEDGTFQRPAVPRLKPSAREGRHWSAAGRPKTQDNRECFGSSIFDVEAEEEEADKDEQAEEMDEGRPGQQVLGRSIFSQETLSQVSCWRDNRFSLAR